jgi:hypothetical protein
MVVMRICKVQHFIITSTHWYEGESGTGPVMITPFYIPLHATQYCIIYVTFIGKWKRRIKGDNMMILLMHSI